MVDLNQISIKDYLRESQLFISRCIAAGTIVIVLLLVVTGRLVYLQIMNHDHYKTLSQDNRVKIEPLPPTRGLVFARNGEILAQNLPAYSLEIVPEKVEDLTATIQAISEIIPVSEEDIKLFHHLRKQSRRFDSIPVAGAPDRG